MGKGRARRDRARRDGAITRDARDAASRDEIATLERQLRALNLERRAVEADGNCFFRALADQRYGDESRHAEVRRRVVARVEARREAFAPFVEDDETFDEYVERMARDGEWAGHLEVNAATAALRVGICIHQAGSPRWVAGADARDDGAKTYHVSYEGRDHYNSVRLRNSRRFDEPGGPLSVAMLKDDKLCALARRTGCVDAERLRRTLRACRGDADACADVLEEEMEEERRSREKAVEDGIDVEEFDTGDWAEVKTKKKSKGKGGAKHSRGGARDEDFGVESLRI